MSWWILIALLVTTGGVVLSLALPPLSRRAVALRFGGYVHRFHIPDPALPGRVDGQRRVAVIGGGLAGIAAATTLAERGVSVILLERNPYLGGKIGAWDDTVSDGSTQRIDHGFHAFFGCYYNLDRFLGRLGVRQRFTRIPDYRILTRDGGYSGFAEVETTPVLNLISLARAGMYRWQEIALTPALHRMDALLLYDPEATYEALDHVSFARFARDAHIPSSLMLSFNTFSRAFFADPDDMSMAELVKSFHFYYLSQDAGLLYEYPTDDYETALLTPITAHLHGQGVHISLGHTVHQIQRDGDRFVVVDDQGGREVVDGVVLATTGPAARALVEASPDLGGTELARRTATLRASSGYAVLRLWIDADIRDDIPPYVVVERMQVLDAIASLHRITRGCREQVTREGGAILELHGYAVPGHLSDQEVRDILVAELHHFLPEIKNATLVREHLQRRRDFTAYHTGLHADRPEVTCDVDGLVCAGDWVKLDLPACLMEAAFTSGLLAANALLAREGVQGDLVLSVPPRGMLVGLPGRLDKLRGHYPTS